MIIFWYVILVLMIRGLQDAGLRKVEHTLRDNLKPGYDLKLIDKISTLSSYVEFGGAGGTSWSAGTSDQCFKVSTYGEGGAP